MSLNWILHIVDIKFHSFNLSILFFFSEAESVQECTSNLSITEQWKCFDPVYFYGHVFTPVFFVSSTYDMWFIRHSLGVTCPLLSCSKDDVQHIEKYKENIMKSVKSIVFSVHDGVFLTSCPVHTLLVKPWYSSKIMVNYMTVQQAIGQWYFHRYPKSIKNVENFNYTQVLNRCPPVYWCITRQIFVINCHHSIMCMLMFFFKTHRFSSLVNF